MTRDVYDPADYYDRECCKRGASVVYRHGLTMSHCHEGTRDTWENAPYKCNESHRIFGEVAD